MPWCVWPNEPHLVMPFSTNHGVAIIFRESFSFHRLPLQAIAGIDYELLTLETKNRLGFLLIFQPPSSPLATISELAEVLSDVMMKSPRFIVLVQHSCWLLLCRVAQDFIAFVTALGLFQIVTSPILNDGRTLDLMFCCVPLEGGVSF